MMEHTPGAIQGVQNTRNSDNGVVAVLAPSSNTGLGGANSLKVDQWNVDNIRIDGNVISSTDTDGDIDLDPNGSGEVHIQMILSYHLVMIRMQKLNMMKMVLISYPLQVLI